MSPESYHNHLERIRIAFVENGSTIYSSQRKSFFQTDSDLGSFSIQTVYILFLV